MDTVKPAPWPLREPGAREREMRRIHHGCALDFCDFATALDLIDRLRRALAAREQAIALSPYRKVLVMLEFEMCRRATGSGYMPDVYRSAWNLVTEYRAKADAEVAAALREADAAVAARKGEIDEPQS